MSTTFAWNIAQMERETADGYVFTVHYTVDAVSDDQVYRAGAYGSLGLERPEGSMIPFADLTPEVVIGWVIEKFGAEKVTEIEGALQAQLDEQRAPSKQSGLPWAVAPAAA
jgi:hypothetical protein